jgi:quercetin dioxygenase-like cupin family protein
VLITHVAPAFADGRGVITDILQHVPVDSVTIITFVKGAVRGNHYHQESLQYAYVLSGRIRALAQMPDRPVESAELGPGDLLETPPPERHALEALEDSLLLVVTRGPRGGANYESDTIRIPPLRHP